jgi:hypothetical protein
MIYKITFGFAGPQGWGETHAMLSSSNDPIQLVPTVSDIATKRAQFLGREFWINAIRIARYANDAGQRVRGVKLVKKVFANSVQTLAARAEPAEVALLAEATAAPSGAFPQFNANTNRTFPGNGGLGAAFASWAAAMKAATMGWLASDTILNTAITTITQNMNGTVQLVCEGPLIPTLVQGQQYRARIRQVNDGHSPLNGEVIVRCTDNLTLVTQSIIGIARDQIGGHIRIYKPVAPFIGYGDITLAENVGNHKRGAPFGSRRARRPRRVRG